MKRTKAAALVLEMLEAVTRADGFDSRQLVDLVAGAEEIARGRGSTVLGRKHVIESARRMGYGGVSPAEAEARVAKAKRVADAGAGSGLAGQR